MNNNQQFSKIVSITVLILLMLFTGGCGLVRGDKDKSSSINNNSNPIPSNFLNNNPITIGPANIADMVEKASPAVVNIETNTVVSNSDVFFNNDFFRDFFGNNGITPRQNVQTGVGTGFLISDDGYILTNQHVIDKASSVTVRMANNDTDYSARVVGQDYELDLAVLKIDGNTKFTTLTLGDSDRIRAGEWVIAIGNPYGLDHTVTVGVVSAKGRPINIEKRVYRNLIQTDAAINPGNSGGPLLNTNGEVIGINTAVNSEAQGIGFAISVNTAKEIINELIQTGKVTRPYMGVWLQPMDENFAARNNLQNTGVIVANVIAGGPAEKAGLKINDVIISLNDTNIKNYDQLQDFLKTRQVGEKVMVKVIRAGKTLTIPVILAEKPSA
jgi:Do/DeqQ family serine protease